MTYEKLYEDAENYYVKGDYEEALNLFNKALVIQETNDCLNYIGCCYLQLEDFLSAIRIFKSLIKKCPDWERPVFNLGRIYLTLRKQNKALKCFEKAVAINPNNEDAYYYLEVYYFKYEDYIRAKKYYEKSLMINDKQSEVHLNLGMCYLRLNSYDKALEEFEIAYKYDNECIDAVYNKCVVLICMENYQEALKNLILLNTIEPDDVEILMDIAHCYYKIRCYEDSKVWINKLLSKEPEHDLAKKLYRRLIHLTR